MESIIEKAAGIAALPMTHVKEFSTTHMIAERKPEKAELIKSLLELMAEKNITVSQAVNILDEAKAVMLDCTRLNTVYPVQGSTKKI